MSWLQRASHALTPFEGVLGLRQHFSDAQIVELGLGVGLFMALSKVMITLGLEPENMPTTVLPTPSVSNKKESDV
jgi:alkylhydroperoxidase family enzyme